MSSVLILMVAYLLGSIPFGLLLTKLAGLGDIRQIGSGNIGATNVLRTGSKKLAALTLLCDALKGVVAVVLARAVDPDMASYAALVSLLGHMYPVWLQFKGGKGVATAAGVLMALSWPVGVSVVVTWVLVAYASRTSSLAALVGAALAPVYALFSGHGFGFIFITLVISALVVYRHKLNIQRLLDGTEPKIGADKTQSRLREGDEIAGAQSSRADVKSDEPPPAQ